MAFCVASQAALQAWENELSARGIACTPAAQRPIGSVVVFRDPDHSQLGFWLPAELPTDPRQGPRGGPA